MGPSTVLYRGYLWIKPSQAQMVCEGFMSPPPKKMSLVHWNHFHGKTDKNVSTLVGIKIIGDSLPG